uniref:Uncharacterized protein n=1 Tax=Plectus sambesii TaxID=2011161 RepID=A0A914WTC7_9BILA
MIAMEKPLKLKSDNPISMLNEACSKRGLKMKTTVETVDGLPVGPQSRYKCIIDLGEKGQFETEGPSKKGAKTAVACQILDQVFGVKAREFNLDTVMKSPAERKPPVQLLFELCQIQGGESKTVAYEFVEEIVMGKTPHYVMKVRVGEQEFVGQGMSKKLAKTQAAREALRVLFLVETPDPSLKSMVPTKRSFASAMVGEDGARADWPMPKMQRFSIQTSSDVISSLVLNKYLQLCTQHRIPPTSYLAGFVLTQGPALCDGQVVSLASGAKATTYAAVVGQKGLALIDSHAEVLARRGLILFFYQDDDEQNDSQRDGGVCAASRSTEDREA